MSFLLLSTLQPSRRVDVVVTLILSQIIVVPSFSLLSTVAVSYYQRRRSFLPKTTRSTTSSIFHRSPFQNKKSLFLPHSYNNNLYPKIKPLLLHLMSSNNKDNSITFEGCDSIRKTSAGKEEQTDTTEGTAEVSKSEVVLHKISYTSTLCIVPPESNVGIWQQLTQARTDLKDPGLFRWPPHINLLYPFYEIPTINPQQKQGDITTTDEEENSILSLLSQVRKATSQINPFHVSLHSFGCFGGKKRGVLWLYPSPVVSQGEEEGGGEPIKQLHFYLQQEFPTLLSNNKNTNSYHPHMTLSHFGTLTEAKDAQNNLEEWWPSCSPNNNNDTMNIRSPMDNDITTFYVKEIYMLQRHGDSGQFHRVATIPLGNTTVTTATANTKEDGPAVLQSCNNYNFIRHIPPKPFLLMPTTEEDWVRAERMKLKERRNKRNRRKT